MSETSESNLELTIRKSGKPLFNCGISRLLSYWWLTLGSARLTTSDTNQVKCKSSPRIGKTIFRDNF